MATCFAPSRDSPSAGCVALVTHRATIGRDRQAMARLTVQPDDLALLVIDVQPYFLDGWMAGASEPLLARLEYLLGLATAYDLPCLATFEQPVDQKGWLPERLEPFFPSQGQRFTKNTFNCCGEDEITSALARLGRSQFAVA